MSLKKTNLIFGTVLLAFVVISLSSDNKSFAEQQSSTTEIIPINSNMGIEKTTISMNIPLENNLPWAFVEGKITQPVPAHPVIIQIFDNEDQINGNNLGAVHFAQIGVNEEGAYEYKFRIFDQKGENRINIFEGYYTVNIFKVVYLDTNLTSI